MVVQRMMSPASRSLRPSDLETARRTQEWYREFIVEQMERLPDRRQRMLEAARRAEQARDTVLLRLCGQ